MKRAKYMIGGACAALGLAGLLAAALSVRAHGKVDEPGPAVEEQVRLEHGERRIEVDLGSQMLIAFEDEEEVMKLPVSSGRDDRTPKGVFRIWKKHRLKDMKVGLVVLGRYYTLRNVPWIMYYYSKDVGRSRGFAIHGTYWHNDFGRPVSHGCINMDVEDAKRLFHWVGPYIGGEEHGTESEENPGTEVVVYGTPPREWSPR